MLLIYELVLLLSKEGEHNITVTDCLLGTGFVVGLFVCYRKNFSVIKRTPKVRNSRIF